MAYLMIVDDDQPLANALATVLDSAGYEVGTEFSIENARESMKRRRPDLVLLDVMFPEDMTAGFSLARKMRHYKEEFRNVPVIMMTAINQESPIQFSERDIDETWLPVSDFMNKPVDFDEMLEKISKLLETNTSNQN